ncbi:hypothetical protein [Motiliproteus sediminis]|uniref:hypothetical protein n=1 Tax=Motiliproteus sediminis TaxID=1468178 RepID=UPI001AEF61FB|nr:hypothetical protein [Motiliproteus sediminis]
MSINYYYHQREQQERLRQQRSRQLKKEIQQTVDALTALRTVETPAEILSLLSDHSAQLIGQLAKLNPASGVIDQLRSQNNAPATQQPPAVGLHSVKLVQSAIRVALTIMRRQQQHGRLTPLQLAEHSKELAWLHSASEANIYINEGRRLLENDKRALAISHFKHAKTLISKVSSKEQRRQPKLVEINQLLDDANPFKPPPPIATEDGS